VALAQPALQTQELLLLAGFQGSPRIQADNQRLTRTVSWKFEQFFRHAGDLVATGAWVVARFCACHMLESVNGSAEKTVHGVRHSGAEVVEMKYLSH
jgi:hypothetical protein